MSLFAKLRALFRLPSPVLPAYLPDPPRYGKRHAHDLVICVHCDAATMPNCVGTNSCLEDEIHPKKPLKP